MEIHQGLVEGALLILGPGGGVDGAQIADRLAQPLHDVGGGLRRFFPLCPAFRSLLHFFFVLLVGRLHSPDLLLPRDLDEDVLGDLLIAPAFVTDSLGQAVDQHDVGNRGAGLADDAAQLLVGVFLFILEPLQGFGLFDGREVLAEQVLHQRDFGGVALDADGGDGREAGKLGGPVAALAGDDDQVGAVGVDAKENGIVNNFEKSSLSTVISFPM
jgi:hypothetical protein